MKEIELEMTSINIDRRIMKKNLDWRVHGLAVVLSLGMVIGLMTARVGMLKAEDISPTLIISHTLTLSQTEIYTYHLSPTIATVYNTGELILNVRNGPGTEYDKKPGLWKGERVIIRGTNSEECLWVYITRPQSQFGGWVDSSFLLDSQGVSIYDKCPPFLTTISQSQNSNPVLTESVDILDGENTSSTVQPTLFQDHQMLAIGIIALFLTALLYWIFYTKGFFSRLRQTESSAGISANSGIPKTGTPYLETMLTSAQPIYCPLNSKIISIGRDEENTLVIDSRFAQWDTVSSHHARIEQDGDSFVITDLDSKNGVFVDGSRTQENILYDGMRVALGQVAFVFRVNGK